MIKKMLDRPGADDQEFRLANIQHSTELLFEAKHELMVAETTLRQYESGDNHSKVRAAFYDLDNNNKKVASMSYLFNQYDQTGKAVFVEEMDNYDQDTYTIAENLPFPVIGGWIYLEHIVVPKKQRLKGYAKTVIDFLVARYDSCEMLMLILDGDSDIDLEEVYRNILSETRYNKIVMVGSCLYAYSEKNHYYEDENLLQED